MKNKINSFYRGFTLIELMIVIVILGVLMGTILPRLTGAQARARDTGRVADLNTLSQALETYFDDNGEYPALTTPATFNCLTDTSTVGLLLADYLKGGDIPTPPAADQVTQVTGTITCPGQYLYVPLTSRGLAFNGYALVADVETWQNANVDTLVTPLAGSTSAWTTFTTDSYSGFVSASKALTPAEMKTADDANALRTVYMLAN